MKKGTKKKKIIDEVKEEVKIEEKLGPLLGIITPLTQEFGNGELNVLRDKINEIIAYQ